MFVAHLSEIRPDQSALFGEKACALAELLRLGYRVPEGFCLSVKSFRQFLAQSELQHLQEAIVESTEYPEDEMRRSWEIAVRCHMPADLEQEIRRAYGAYEWCDHGSWIVRSSAIGEDSARYSMAGLYRSFPHVRGFESVLQHIKKCWLSLYGREAVHFRRGHGLPIHSVGMGVIVQQMLQPEKAGVLFTSNPVAKGGEEILVEACLGAGSGVASGKICEARYTIAKASGSVQEEQFGSIGQSATKVLTDVELAELRDLAIQLEDKDIEWAFQDGQLFVLQCRPITAHAPVFTGGVKIADVDDLGACAAVAMNNCASLFRRWLRKRYWIRKHAIRNGFKVDTVYYIEYAVDALRGYEFDHVLNLFSTQCVLLDVDSRNRVVVLRKDSLLDKLLSLPPDSSCPFTVRVRECLAAEMGGISTPLPSGEIYVEYSMGQTMGIAKTNPSSYLLAADGSVLKSSIVPTDMHHSLDERRAVWQWVSHTPEYPTLSSEHLRQIWRLTKTMGERFGETRVEWLIHEGQVYCLDLTIESSSLDSILDSPSVISRGTARGRVLKLMEIEKLEETLDTKYHISVRRGEGFRLAQEDDAILHLRSKIERVKEPVILVCKYPATCLSLLTDRVAAFIFEQGSLLSHLAIILREDNVPAVFLPGALSRLEDGEDLTVGADGWIHRNFRSLEPAG